MTLPGPLSEREHRLAQWNFERTLEGSADAFLSAVDDVIIELGDTPWWRPFKKASLRAEWVACYRLALVFKDYAEEQADVASGT